MGKYSNLKLKHKLILHVPVISRSYIHRHLTLYVFLHNEKIYRLHVPLLLERDIFLFIMRIK